MFGMCARTKHQAVTVCSIAQGPRRRLQSHPGPLYTLALNDDETIAQNIRDMRGPVRLGRSST
jgi:hypothetical protein